jgi:hypothetical protein
MKYTAGPIAGNTRITQSQGLAWPRRTHSTAIHRVKAVPSR